ncbi:1,6-anhydro-N-acetylmuramyl-L-alanine amidase AmpD [Inhella gelatinilytica]|uniref:1,6-anhydro-N-acetylmuramyl-L-alanine amidase AmpD n=1 Tax=Inhella gelatinilytica TaxID=2795030 RepID=UPI002873721E|nr:1,6-anhydro-N-acetylmuramyl-L-alanine amidase AmpD [Inhella gelatinilytica]
MSAVDRPQQTWADGWWAPARRVPSPHHNARPHGVAVEGVVLHSISLPAGSYGGPEVEDLFLNRLDLSAHESFESLRGLQVSAHFFIRREGACLQFVPVQARAWHAGRSSFLGRENCNDFTVGIELEGLEGHAFEPAQYRSLVRLLRALRQVIPLRWVAGHEHIAPGRKGDPGPGFDWAGLQRRLRWSAGRFPFA